ncbi:MAG: L-seryl-tRNA(Sec) selenium transferase [Deltaproteobacteria bacterium]|nr:MAG: L-seryl-tRNA(Sec) selenium transferase [Deltaproteobacteria bacterium]
MGNEEKQSLLRKLPQVDELLRAEVGSELQREYPRRIVVEAIQKVLDDIRKKILSSSSLPSEEILEAPYLSERIREQTRTLNRRNLRPLINATGVILHTNLGRALLAEEAWEDLSIIATSYCNLEFDLAQGVRGNRYSHVEELLCRLTGAESAVVVNNNAGAVLLTLNTLARGKEVVVSRGELVEIGGSFRIPEVMRGSGALLVEVGTTNKTHLKDYQKVISEKTGLLLKVHRSNFQMIGFTSEVGLPELVELGREKGIPVMEDLGSGCLIELSPFGLPGEPTVSEVVKSGVEVVSFSGDKLLGGPQAGIILGRKETLERIKANPIHRALRIDKLTLTALESTLRLYLDQETVLRKIPALRLLTTPLDAVHQRAKRLLRRLKKKFSSHFEIEVVDTLSQVGGGTLPQANIPSKALALKPIGFSVEELDRRLRGADLPVIGRLNEDRLLLDIRTVQDTELKSVEKTLESTLYQTTKK